MHSASRDELQHDSHVSMLSPPVGITRKFQLRSVSMNKRIVGVVAVASLVSVCVSACSAQSTEEGVGTNVQSLTLAGTRLYTPKAQKGGVDQVAKLTSEGRKDEARLISSMLKTPQAVWLE